MLKHRITYVDFNGGERNEDFYFNLTTKELLELDKSVEGGFKNGLTNMLSKQDVYSIYELIQRMILKAYGQKSEDGRFFKKTPEIAEEFENSAAFQAMLDDFIANPETANSFVTGILPKDLREKLDSDTTGNASASVLAPAT